MTFNDKFDYFYNKVNSSLDKVLINYTSPEKRVFEAARYSLEAGGKRIRPILSLGFCDMLSGSLDDALVMGVAIECIHTYSLIHDDLPCMDDDDLRRGKPTCHKKFDEATAVLAGDALLNFAFEYLSDINNYEKMTPENLIKAINYIGRCSGAYGMIGGQAVDLSLENCSDVDVETLKYLDNKKTGALIRAASVAGVIAAGGEEKDIKIAEEFALNLGLAFQIKDDILDCIGNQEELGKNIGSDKENGKSTYVSILGLEKAQEYLNEYTKKAVDSLSVYGEKSDFLIQLSYELLNRNK